ncbi:MAG: hypothetical protein HS104_12950 [Polyangiaceae bacterium]|nr:hypothetical protein [Polyangiaceae bacterium]
MRARVLASAALLTGMFAVALGCSAMIDAELTHVNCSWEGAIGPPACPAGQLCRAGVCAPCAASEICGDGFDNDCRNGPDDGCGSGGLGGGSGAGGAGGDAGGGSGGATGGAPGGGGVAGAAAGGGSGGASGCTTGGGGSGGASGGTGGSSAGAIGSPCANHAACDAGLFCEDPGAFGAAGGAKLCTRGCCKSDQCGASTNVCYPAVHGGSACVPASSVGRAEVGTKAAGDSCTTHGECRSGLCEANQCFDTCCADSDCSGAQYCVRRTLPGSTRQVMACGKNPGNGGFLALCSSGASCQSGLCLTAGACTKSCCSSKDCAGTISLACIHSDGLRFCGSFSGGTKAVGETCAASAECKSGKCISGGSYCSDTCCSDFDCGPGFACRAASLSGTNQLLCVKL